MIKKVGPWTIPRGGLVQMNLYSLHRNKDHWGDPHTFRPERFIKNGLVVQVKVTTALNCYKLKIYNNFFSLKKNNIPCH